MELLSESEAGEHLMIKETYSAEETFAFGKQLGQDARAGEIYLLVGELGAGKTVLTQGFAAGLGIVDPVNSPTFTILQRYDGGRLVLYHFDVYRIESPEEMNEIGWEDCVYGNGVCILEWADRIQDVLPETGRKIVIEKDATRGYDYRRITISDLG